MNDAHAVRGPGRPTQGNPDVLEAAGATGSHADAADDNRRRGRRLATLLIGLVMAVLLPALAAGGGVAWQMARSYRVAAEGRLRDTATALAAASRRFVFGRT